jgi:acyl-CoA synthetase
MSDRAERRNYYRDRGLHTDARIGWVLTRACERWPDNDAIIFEDRRITYRQLWRWSTAVANDLVASGLRPGHRLVWQLPNCLEALVLHWAGWRVGAVCVPVVSLYREHEMAHILSEVKPTVVAFASAQGARHPALEMQALMDTVGIKPEAKLVVGTAFDDWAAVRPEPGPDEAVDDQHLPAPGPADEHCLTLYTSGTTHAPKGVRHSSLSLLAAAGTLRDTYGFSHRDSLIMGAPIAHIAGLLITSLVPMTVGGTSVLLPGWDPDRAISLAEQEHAIFSGGATVFLQDFVQRYESGVSPGHRIGMFLAGGSAVPPSIIERADAVGIKAFRCWGMTEAPILALGQPNDPLEFRAHRDGRLSEGTQVQAVDEDRRPLPPGQTGELRLRSHQQMLGYTDPEVNALQVDDDDWFYTGDVGSVDDAGWVTISGRVKDIINRGGEKFSSQDIENAIASHPTIASVAVIGAPDERLGEKVVAFATLRPGAEWPGRESLLAHLESQRLAKQKFPVAWRVLDELPMTMSGKLQKFKLLELWNGELAAQSEPA